MYGGLRHIPGKSDLRKKDRRLSRGGRFFPYPMAENADHAKGFLSASLYIHHASIMWFGLPPSATRSIPGFKGPDDAPKRNKQRTQEKEERSHPLSRSRALIKSDLSRHGGRCPYYPREVGASFFLPFMISQGVFSLPLLPFAVRTSEDLESRVENRSARGRQNIVSYLSGVPLEPDRIQGCCCYRTRSIPSTSCLVDDNDVLYVVMPGGLFRALG